MSILTVCKNVIASNNKRGWKSPDPPIRIAATRAGKVTARGFTVHIKDAAGRTVASVITTKDGGPVVKCGAKVAIVTVHPVEIEE